MSENWKIDYGNTRSTDIAISTTARRAYELWLEKQKQIANLEYESDVLVDKYHAEMRRANIPGWLRGNFVGDLFDKDEKRKELARKHFLEMSFSEEFLAKHEVEFERLKWFGYHRTAAVIELGIGDYTYTMEIPIPENIVKEEDRKMLMGGVRFRVDRLHKSKKDEFIKEMEAVQMPTYDWKECFDAIEAVVGKGEPKTQNPH